ncbi:MULTISPECIES: Lrp/AsnC family transcriptional regulator [Paenibacillus]|uniref:Lrp/AsnC family transcriptional regulator n=1 Tax=Paenibacillus TaxID=44249 RepID=UPI0008F34C60|nr:Lrp/AsnC family transcriptional regulator [Paenibacillus sp. UNC496MF]SFJ43002.1 DNA-binding transcriptional regulator, Lrp family [Paenibacillus sp. UNC496MF]
MTAKPPQDFALPAVDLDETDRKILTSLHENARISYTELGKLVGLSRVAVQTRIAALMDEGVIERFTAVINPARIGIDISAFFNVEVEPQFLEDVSVKLAEEPEVTSLYHMSGPSKLHMHGIFASIREMERFLVEKVYAMPGIVSVDSQLLLKRYKSRMGMKL